jgi:hypothetical protein
MLCKNKLYMKKGRRIDCITLIFFFLEADDDFAIFDKRYYPLNANGATFPRVDE